MKVKVFHIRLTKEHLQTDQDNLSNFLESVTVKKTANELINAQPNFWSTLVFYEEKKAGQQEGASEKYSVLSDSELTTDEKYIYEALREWRQYQAEQLNLPSYMVAHNVELMAIAKFKPQTLDDLVKIKGFGGQKTAKYGDDIIAILNAF